MKNTRVEGDLVDLLTSSSFLLLAQNSARKSFGRLEFWLVSFLLLCPAIIIISVSLAHSMAPPPTNHSSYYNLPKKPQPFRPFFNIQRNQPKNGKKKQKMMVAKRKSTTDGDDVCLKVVVKFHYGSGSVSSPPPPTSTSWYP